VLLAIRAQRFDYLFDYVVRDIDRRQVRRAQDRFDHPVGVPFDAIRPLDDFRGAMG
jgi:hypothetical protein